MKNKIIAIFLLIIMLVFAAAPLFSCDKTANEPTDAQREKFIEYFTQVYTVFNNHEFDKYLEYIDMEAETEAQVKTNLESLVKYFNSEYNIEELSYDDNGDGTYNVTIQFLVNVTELATKVASKIREVDLFVVKPSGDSYVITKIVQGESYAVTEEATS